MKQIINVRLPVATDAGTRKKVKELLERNSEYEYNLFFEKSDVIAFSETEMAVETLNTLVETVKREQDEKNKLGNNNGTIPTDNSTEPVVS